MKYFLCLLPMLAFLLCSSSCRKVAKDVADYYPAVRTVSATVQEDGSVLVKGALLREGLDPASFLGFCMDTAAKPGMLSGQQLTDTIRDGIFQAVYRDLKPFTRYYFRAFAANANGYAYGEPIAIDNVIVADAAISCLPAADTISLISSYRSEAGRVMSVSAPQRNTTEWEIDVYASGASLRLNFSTYPGQGIYTITEATSFSSSGRYVRVMFSGSVTYGTLLSPGTKLYIKPIDTKHFELRFCDAALQLGPGYKVSARFIFPV